ncbi:MAG: YceI family protein [Bacteroidetes bacterium]|nr:MAG: YceI family protein [Bacteroidota bacterium]
MSLWLTTLAGLPAQDQVVFYTDQGTIAFASDAPLELIEARSRQMQGLINPAEGTFAFAVPINTFEGFNSPLQQEHFNENYLESETYPRATFRGKIIESVDFAQPGTRAVRAKGILTVHGVEQERIIGARLTMTEDVCRIEASFQVLLQDHRISIPKVVKQKIAEEITVDVQAELRPRTGRI